MARAKLEPWGTVLGMRYEHRDLNVPASVTSGASLCVNELAELTLQVSGTFTQTLKVMGRAKPGGAWLQVGTDVSAPGWVSLAMPLYEIRIDVSAHTSGPAAVVLAGWNVRGE